MSFTNNFSQPYHQIKYTRRSRLNGGNASRKFIFKSKCNCEIKPKKRCKAFVNMKINITTSVKEISLNKLLKKFIC